jgi:PAS domain S-box-containing protein
MKEKILIIDDEETIRFAFDTHLSKEGHGVTTAADYNAAISAMDSDNFDVIFADIILPDRSGIDILEEVKKRGLNCPVIMITGEPNIDTSAKALRLGAFDYLTKPIRKENLLRSCNLALQHKKLLDEKQSVEAENERYRQNLEAIFRSLKDGIVTVDPEMCVIQANKASELTCSLLPEKMIGKTFPPFASRCRKACERILKKTLDTQKTMRDCIVECGRKDRPSQTVRLTTTVLKEKDRYSGAVLVVTDITRLTDLEKELKTRHQFQKMIGQNARMQEVYRLIEDLTDVETNVLITGASGTGKELVAKALHYRGSRAEKPMVTVNCSSLAESLLESELFGHVKGAFTGAIKDKTGRFQLAHGGTIFLDEIGDISSGIQLKLLRVIEEKIIEKVGDVCPVPVDVRIIAATNQNLKEKVRLGEFREDLYYRLKVIEIALPPLTERRGDIPLLVDYFCGLYRIRFKKNILSVSPEVMAAFMRYTWPGNVRELENALEHAFVLCRSGEIEMAHLPSEILEHTMSKDHEKKDLLRDEREEILHTLNKTDWNKAKAARLLGMSRPTLYQKIKTYQLAKPAS